MNYRFCVVGNIVKQHIDAEGIIRYGTKAFIGGTKVYMNGMNCAESDSHIEVIGRNRFGRIVTDYIPKELIENVRAKRVYNPAILDRIYLLINYEGGSWWSDSVADCMEAKAFVKRWKA